MAKRTSRETMRTLEKKKKARETREADQSAHSSSPLEKGTPCRHLPDVSGIDPEASRPPPTHQARTNQARHLRGSDQSHAGQIGSTHTRDARHRSRLLEENSENLTRNSRSNKRSSLHPLQRKRPLYPSYLTPHFPESRRRLLMVRSAYVAYLFPGATHAPYTHPTSSYPRHASKKKGARRG